MVSQIQSQVNIQAYEIECGLSIFVGGLTTKKSLRPWWLGKNQGKTGEKCEVKVVVIYANIT